MHKVEEPVEEACIMTVAHMKDHFCLRIQVLHDIVSKVDQSDEIACSAALHLSQWPQHSVIDLIAQLHPFDIYPIVLE